MLKFSLLAIFLAYEISLANNYKNNRTIKSRYKKKDMKEYNSTFFCFFTERKWLGTSELSFSKLSKQSTTYTPQNQFEESPFCSHRNMVRNEICKFIEADSITLLFQLINKDNLSCYHNKTETVFHIQLLNGYTLQSGTTFKKRYSRGNTVEYSCMKNGSLGSNAPTKQSLLLDNPKGNHHTDDTPESLCQNNEHSAYLGLINDTLLLIKPQILSFTLNFSKLTDMKKLRSKLYYLKQEIMDKTNTFTKDTLFQKTYAHVISNSFEILCRTFEISQCFCEHFKIMLKANFNMKLCHTSTITMDTIVGLKPSSIGIKNLCVHYAVNSKLENIPSDVCSLTEISVEPKKKVLPFNDNFEDLCKDFSVSESNCTCDHIVIDNVSLCKISDYMSSFYFIYANISCFAALLAITGNGLALIIAYKKREELSKCKILFAQLAFCDWLFALVILITSVHLFWTPEWPFGTALCKILEPLMDLCVCVAIGVIMIISIERYIGIVKPFARGIPLSTLHVLTLSNVFVGIAVITPTVIYKKESTQLCLTGGLGPKVSLIYDLILLIFYFFLPLFVITYLYLSIILTLKTKQINTVTNQRMIERRRQEYKKTISLLIMVVLSFVFLILPKRVIYLYNDLTGRSSIETFRRNRIRMKAYFNTIYIAHIPYPFHVAINPIIYSFMDVRWKKSIKRLFGKRPKKSISVKNTVPKSTSFRRRKDPAISKLPGLDNKYGFANYSKQFLPDSAEPVIDHSSQCSYIKGLEYSASSNITIDYVDIPTDYRTNKQQNCSEKSAKFSVNSGPSLNQAIRRQINFKSYNLASVEIDLSTTFETKRREFSESSNMTSIESDFSTTEVAD